MTTATAVKNNVVWFEIPSTDYDRAVKFYETIFNFELNKMDFMGTPTAVFNYEKPAISGCVVKEDALRAGASGSVVYLNADGIFDEVLARVPKAGGKVVSVIELPKGMGRAARIIDTEGNVVGLHTY
ncbi:MAG TPA: VOC family protein [Terriglobales bacterium]|nr:VOC family protein [Terriglobales bacterium]